MSRNSSGTYSLPSGNPVVSGSIISSVWANDTMNDIASALTDSLSRSGKGGMSAAFRSIDGVVATPGISFNSETGSGLYLAGAGDVRLAILGADVIKATAAGAAVTGTLSSSGAATLFSLGVTNNATVGGTLGVTGNTTLSGALGVTGSTTLSTLGVTSNATVGGPLSVTGNTTLSGTLGVGGTLGVTGNTTLSGTLGVTGDATLSGNLAVNGQTITSTSSTAYYPQTILKNKTADANAGYYVFDKDRAGAIVQSGDILGNMVWRGFDGTNYVQAAAITVYVNGTPGANDMPGGLGFFTSADGTSSPARRAFIDQAGDLTLDHINSNTSSSAPNVYVDANGKLFKSTSGYSRLVQGTAQATTSGTAVGFTGIPSWVKRITLQANGVVSSSNNTFLQIGSGSYTTSGYVVAWAYGASGASPSVGSGTGGFYIGSGIATNAITAQATLVNISGNTWNCAITDTSSGATNYFGVSNGYVTLAGALTQIKIGSTGTFSAGSVNIIYEG